MTHPKYVVDIWVGERPDIQLYVDANGRVEMSLTSEDGEAVVRRNLNRAILQALLENIHGILAEGYGNEKFNHVTSSNTPVRITRHKIVRSG